MGVRTFTAGGKRRYAIEFEIRGHRIFRRLPAGATKEQAQQLETRLKHEFIDQAIIGKRPNVPLETAIRAWLAEKVAGRKSEKQTGSHAESVISLCVGEPFSALLDVAGKIREMGGLAPATRNRRLCILKATAKYAWRQGWAEDNQSGKVELLPEKSYERREVTPAHARLLIAAATTPRAKALIALSAYTGLRLGEVLKLQPEDVRRGVIVARDTKNGTDRIIPILPELKPHLKALPFDAGWRNVYRGFERARKAAGLDLRYHDLRHMVGSALTNTGADLRLVGDILGHESLQTTRRYTHPNIEVKRAAMELALAHQNPIRRRKTGKKKAAKAA